MSLRQLISTPVGSQCEFCRIGQSIILLAILLALLLITFISSCCDSQLEVEPAVRIELTTHGLQNRCSTAELSWHLHRRHFLLCPVALSSLPSPFAGSPRQIQQSKPYSSPQRALTWATPRLTASTGNDGLSSKTLMWPGFTNGFSAAKSTVPEPGGAWSAAGNFTSWT